MEQYSLHGKQCSDENSVSQWPEHLLVPIVSNSDSCCQNTNTKQTKEAALVYKVESVDTNDPLASKTGELNTVKVEVFDEMKGALDNESAGCGLSVSIVDVELLNKIKEEPIDNIDNCGSTDKVLDEVKVELDTDIIVDEPSCALVDMEVLDKIKEEPIDTADNFDVDINAMYMNKGHDTSRNISTEHIDVICMEHNMIPKVIDVKQEQTDGVTDCTGATQKCSDHWNQFDDRRTAVIKEEMDIDNVSVLNVTTNCTSKRTAGACARFGLSDMQDHVFRRDCHKINDNMDIKAENSMNTLQCHAQKHSYVEEKLTTETDNFVEAKPVKRKRSAGRHTQEDCSNTTSQHSVSSVISEKKVYTCGVCNKEFIKRSSLRSHMITHTGETPYTCHFCDKGFNVRSNLNVHLLIHTGQRPYECDICRKSFRQAGQLKAHLLIHKGEKPYTCTVCARAFRNSSALVTHQRTHTGEKPFVCDVCSRSFSTSTSLKTHRVTHSGKMLYDCPLCGKQFNRRNNLNVHIKRHDKNRSFSCPMCASGFVMRAHLLAHLRLSHKVDVHHDEVKYKCLMDVGDSAVQSTDTAVGGTDTARDIELGGDIVQGADTMGDLSDTTVEDGQTVTALDVKMVNGGKQLGEEFVPGDWSIKTETS